MTDTEYTSYCAFTYQAWDSCCIGCDKPGIGAANHDPGNNSCNDCALCCVPVTILGDILFFPYRLCVNCTTMCCGPNDDLI